MKLAGTLGDCWQAFSMWASDGLDVLCRMVVWHAPRRLVKWAVVRAAQHAAGGSPTLPYINVPELLRRWANPDLDKR